MKCVNETWKKECTTLIVSFTMMDVTDCDLKEVWNFSLASLPPMTLLLILKFLYTQSNFSITAGYWKLSLPFNKIHWLAYT